MRLPTPLATFFIIAIVASSGCDDENVSPLQPTESASFDQGGMGIGVTFDPNYFSGFTQVDPDGDFCQALMVSPLDDINDFIRTNPDGTQVLYFHEHPARVTATPAGGSEYTGLGTMTARGTGDPPWVLEVFHVQARVSDGLNERTAVCHFVREDAVTARVNSIRLN